MNPIAVSRRLLKGTNITIAFDITGVLKTRHKLIEDNTMYLQVSQTETENLLTQQMSDTECKGIAIKLDLNTGDINWTAPPKIQADSLSLKKQKCVSVSEG